MTMKCNKINKNLYNNCFEIINLEKYKNIEIFEIANNSYLLSFGIIHNFINISITKLSDPYYNIELKSEINYILHKKILKYHLKTYICFIYDTNLVKIMEELDFEVILHLKDYIKYKNCYSDLIIMKLK